MSGFSDVQEVAHATSGPSVLDVPATLSGEQDPQQPKREVDQPNSEQPSDATRAAPIIVETLFGRPQQTYRSEKANQHE